MGTHAKVRKSAAKTWLMPAVSTAVAVAAPGAIGESIAAPITSSAVQRTADLHITPQAATPEFAALQARFAKRNGMKLHGGIKNSYVKWVQWKLRVKMTRYYGDETQDAVKRFQKAKGLRQTGVIVVRDATWKKLEAIGKGKTYKWKTTTRTTRSTRASRSSVRLPSGSKVSRVLAAARALSGTKYTYGGEGIVPRNSSKQGMDCSAYINHVFSRVGVNLPRTSRQIYAYLRSRGKALSPGQVRPGDLFFVKDSSGRIYHVGIVSDKGTWLEARNSRYDVGEFSVWEKKRSRLLYARAL